MPFNVTPEPSIGPSATASISGHAIQYATNPKALAPNGWWEGVQHVSVGPDAVSKMITGLQNGVTYYFRLAASNSVGYGDWTPKLAATPTFAPTVPSVPQSLLATPGNGSVDTSWSPPAEIGGGRLADYRLEVSTSRSFTGIIRTETTSSTSFRVGGLTNGSTYYFRVAGSNTVVGFYGGSPTGWWRRRRRIHQPSRRPQRVSTSSSGMDRSRSHGRRRPAAPDQSTTW